MERHGLKTLQIEKLVLPGDIKHRMTLPRVKALGESLALTGGQPVEPPLVELKSNRLRAGSDRIAACILTGRKTVDCLLVSGTDKEMEQLTLIENAHRRHEPDAQLKAIAKLVDMAMADEVEAAEAAKEMEDYRESIEEELPAKPVMGRPKEAKTVAIEKVAEKLGKTPKAVSRAYQRAKEEEAPKESAKGNEKASTMPAPGGLKAMGLTVPEKVMIDADEIHGSLKAIRALLIKAQTAMTLLEKETGWKSDMVNIDLHAVTWKIGQEIPVSVCPWCKTTKHMHNCPNCAGRGWVGKRGLEHVDAELLAEGANAGIWHGGKWLKLADVAR